MNVAAARSESLAGSVVKIILNASMSLNSDVGFLQSKSAPLSLEKIHQKLQEEAFETQESSWQPQAFSRLGSLTLNIAVSVKIINLFMHYNRIKSEGGPGHPQVVEISVLKKLLEIMRLDSLAILLKVIISYLLTSIATCITYSF